MAGIIGNKIESEIGTTQPNHNPNVLVQIDSAKRFYNIADKEIRALDGVDLWIRKGEFVSLVGPSGSGKSTLMNVIGALDTLTEGSVLVGGQDILEMEDDLQADYRRKMIGFIFQSFNLQSRLTATENVELPLLFSKIPHNKRKSMALTALQIVGLGDRIKHKPTELSGGQQQRVAMARAIVNSPEIILADEPTGNLDEKSGSEIMRILNRLNVEHGITIIMVTHNEIYAQYAKRILHMSEGKIVEDNTGGEV